jgi:hypothetical protein
MSKITPDTVFTFHSWVEIVDIEQLSSIPGTPKSNMAIMWTPNAE